MSAREDIKGHENTDGEDRNRSLKGLALAARKRSRQLLATSVLASALEHEIPTWLCLEEVRHGAEVTSVCKGARSTSQALSPSRAGDLMFGHSFLLRSIPTTARGS